MATSTDLRSAIEEVQNQLPADQLECEGHDEVYEAGWQTQVERRVGALPWWVISAVVHSVIFLLATLLTVALPPAQEDEVIITTDVAKKEEPKYDEKKKRDIFKNPQEVKAETEVENPVVVHEQTEVTDHFETDNNMDSQSARGSEDAISDIPLGGTGVTGSMGVGGGGMAGCFGYRGGGGRKRAVARFGGSKATESAVEAALRWLARHQEADGHWAITKWGGKHEKSVVGITGAALLAFLGAGHTSKAGKFRDNVHRAQNWLVARLEKEAAQKGKGVKYGWFYTDMYQQGMGTLALAEAYGMTKNPYLKKPAQAAVDYIIEAQGSYEAWTYANKKGRKGRNDTSVSGWQVMALKSAKIAGLKVDHTAFQGAMNWLNAATDPATGKCSYASSQKMRGNGSMAMCAAGMLMRQFMGTPRTAPIMGKAGATLSRFVPKWDEKAGMYSATGTNFYYWYYGTLCMFQMGGKDWEAWNKALKPTLVDNQRRGGPMNGSVNDVDGSWNPVGGGGVPAGGRAFSTALGALSLEVYYRYLPMYSK